MQYSQNYTVDSSTSLHVVCSNSPEPLKPTLVSDIETLIPKLDIKNFVLVGYSMGGKVAQLIAGRNLVKGLKGVVLLALAPPTPFELPLDMKEQQIDSIFECRVRGVRCEKCSLSFRAF